MPLTCPTCFAAVPPAAIFCRRCGSAADLADPSVDRAPVDVAVAGRTHRVLGRIAVGSRSAVYRCHLHGGGEGTFKLARDAASNGPLAREADVLRHLHAADPDGRHTPFVPTVVESFGFVGHGSDAAQQANVLRCDPAVRSPADDLYTLADVRAAYPAGLDERDMAWVWRRVLTAIGFAAECCVTHGAVLPCHVLVDPADHKLVLIGWSSAKRAGERATAWAAPAAYRNWRDPLPGGDLRQAARCMIHLLGDDDGDRPPASVDPAIARHLDRCRHATGGHPWAVRAEFDDLIAALWGSRTFRRLTMPHRRHSV